MIVFVLIALVLVLDQLTKWLVRTHFLLGESYDVIDGIFSITYIENKGAAFGLGEGNAFVFILVAVLVSVIMIYYYKKQEKNFWLSLGVSLILSGAWGNLIDRVMKSSVTDMFNFHIWPVFNIADIAVCLGCLFLIIYVFKEPNHR
jgi:signal peptidase II